MKKVAALFVAKNGPYFGLEHVDPWDEARDARKYAGPWPVVCHPPCERWGKYWSGGPNPKAPRRKLGDDDGCFEAGLDALLTYGGALEHPAGSLAWDYFGINHPEADGWQAQVYMGRLKKHHGKVIWCCVVEQGHYGHRARKATYLLVAHVAELPVLKWGPSSGIRLEDGFHSSAERARARARCRDQASETNQRGRTHTHADRIPRHVASRRRASERGMRTCEDLSRKERKMTPIPFRDVLIEIAQGAA